jgi:hypothetical protein
MLVPVRGVAVNVGEQTGDGRYIVPGAVTWAELPLPFAWLVDGDQHADMSEVCPQVGNMTQLLPILTGTAFLGHIDDEIPVGAEALRRMRAGSGGAGNRMQVSIDPDDWAVQIVDMTAPTDEGGMLLLMASGSVPQGQRMDWNAPMRALANARMIPAHVAAAGEGDPLAMGGQVIWEDAADTIIARYTRLRIRGATMCAVAAFSNCYVEIDDGTGFAGLAEVNGGTSSGSASNSSAQSGSLVVTTTVEATAGGADDGMAAGLAEGLAESAPAVAAAAAAAAAPARTQVNLSAPPAIWFEDPGLPFATPLTITNEGRLLGHIAAWGTCHTGYTDQCVTPPRGGDDGYRNFHVGETICADDSRVATGVFAWGIPHAGLSLPMIEAWEHYSDSRAGFGRVVSGEDAHGIWFSGALWPGLTESDIAILRSLSMSGDWRRDPRLRRLGLIAALAVNFPGYPIPRTNSITAAGGQVIDVESWEAPEASMELEGDEIVSLIACGRVAPRAKMNDCGCGDGAELRVQQLEARTARTERLVALLAPAIAGELDQRIR